ncbi:MAG: hypothetical protein RLN60_05650 [Phycisphaerales bacterium]
MPTRPEPTRDETFTRWAGHLRSVSTSGHTETRPVTHAPFRAWREEKSSDHPSIDATGAIDDRLWTLACGIRNLDESASLDDLDELEPNGAGPIRPQGSAKTIEVWTDCELSAIHALVWLGHLLDRPGLFKRAVSTCLWHIEHTQPDNATNHPWAIHVFVVLSELRGQSDARLYAETLLHNCQVTNAAPDPLSAMILADAADALEQIDWTEATR